MHLQRRRLLGALAGMLACPRVVLPSVAGSVYPWNEGGEEPYLYSPDRPISQGHIKWPSEVNDQFLTALNREWFEETTVRSGEQFDGMYFGDDRVISESTDGRRVVAYPERWRADRSRRMRIYYAETADMVAVYGVPEVCGNPCWKILKGSQPPCIPRPK